MYTAIYLYRVSHKQLDAFLQVQREAAGIYRNYGALGDITLLGTNLQAKYGGISFDSALPVAEDEVVLVRLSSFRDKAHYDEAMAKVDADQQIATLNQKITTLLGIGRIVRGEFERVV